MERFDAQNLAQSATSGRMVEMTFENAQGKRFTLSLPTQVAIALTPILEDLKKSTNAVGAYATTAKEWRTARDADGPNVFLEFKGQVPYMFPLNHAQVLWQQVRDHCKEIEGRPARQGS